jgi:hypothetical protein
MQLQKKIQVIVDKETEEWGLKVQNVELKDVSLPADMERTIGKQAEAEREKRAVIIKFRRRIGGLRKHRSCCRNARPNARRTSPPNSPVDKRYVIRSKQYSSLDGSCRSAQGLRRICKEITMRYLVGIDEVGRGPIAGPVAVGAFIFLTPEAKKFFRGVKESKQLTEEKREEWFKKKFKKFKRPVTSIFALHFKVKKSSTQKVSLSLLKNVCKNLYNGSQKILIKPSSFSTGVSKRRLILNIKRR